MPKENSSASKQVRTALTYISPFDERFLKLGRAARLAAENHPGLDSADIMDMLARAVFSGAFDPSPIDLFDKAAPEARDTAENWLHVPIEMPPAEMTPAQRKLSPKPQQYFGANRMTIASVMESLDALPGEALQWHNLLHDIARPEGQEEAFAALTKMPFDHYPKAGRRFLEDIYVPRDKLHRWFTLRQIPVPPFLDQDESQCLKLPSNPAKVKHIGTMQSTRGRPQKAAWRSITKALLELRTEKPKLPKKLLAYEVWKRAAEEFEEGDLPSVATIQRKMGEILRSKGH